MVVTRKHVRDTVVTCVLCSPQYVVQQCNVASIVGLGSPTAPTAFIVRRVERAIGRAHALAYTCSRCAVRKGRVDYGGGQGIGRHDAPKSHNKAALRFMWTMPSFSLIVLIHDIF